MNRFITSMLVAVFCQASFAGIYQVNFQRVSPLKEQQRCAAFVEKTANELAHQSPVQIIDYGCKQSDFVRAWDAQITYQAPSKLQLTSTYTASVYPASFYNNREQCEQRLDAHIEIFSQATGLIPLAAYCMQENSSLRQLWEPRVDGVGEAALKPQNAGLSIWGNLVDEKTTLASYAATASGYGIQISEVGVYRGDIGSKVVIRLYGAEPFHFQDYDAMKYESAAACTAAASEANTFLRGADKPVVVFCEQDAGTTRATLHATALVKLLTPGDVFRATALTTQYATMSACQPVAANISQNSTEVLGAICAGLPGEINIHVFSRP